jgi:hypothetical protein
MINYESAVQFLARLDAARSQGQPIKDGGAFPAGVFAMTDAIVYRAVAPELGRLRADIVTEVVNFYSLTMQSEKTIQVGNTSEGALRVVHEHAPVGRKKADLALPLHETG